MPRPWQWGVEWLRDDGSTFVGAMANEAGARHMVEVGKSGFSPKPVRVMRRPLGEWIPADEGEAVA